MRKPRMWLKHGLKPQKFLQDSRPFRACCLFLHQLAVATLLDLCIAQAARLVDFIF